MATYPIAARLLDLTRLVSRMGRGPMTGIDRVEYAYLQHLLDQKAALFGVVRTGFGYALLDRVGMAGLAGRVQGAEPLGRADLLGRLKHRRNPARAQAEADVRRLAIARATRPFLAKMLRRHLPEGTSYLNTGHANLTHRGLRALHLVPGLRITVLVHDTIPLDYPQYCRPDTINSFRKKMTAVAAHADLVIHTSQDARQRTEAQLVRLGRCPAGVVCNIGVPVPRPNSSGLPTGLDVSQPYFVALGTIEPRKNHAVLLDVWDRLAKLGGDQPRLYIVGARGWSNAAVFSRLDGLGRSPLVQELHGLNDGAVASLLQGAQALLFPSLAEGFGLPPIEAAALGTPVISADLPVIRELLGDNAVYLESTDSYAWMEAIVARVKTPRNANLVKERFDPPSWAVHFNDVLSQV